jgi:hypothetical protein
MLSLLQRITKEQITAQSAIKNRIEKRDIKKQININSNQRNVTNIQSHREIKEDLIAK